MAEGSRPPGAEAEAPAHASGSTSPSPKHSSWLANEVLKRSCEVYFECLIKDFDKGRPGDYFVMSSSGIEVRDFEVVQETLVALMEGNCPIANVRVGDCRIKVPATVGLAKNTNPVHVSIQSLELDILAFPDMMPKARVQEIMARLMGQGDDDDNDTARFDAFRHSVKHNAKIKASWQFAALDVLEGPHALAAMLVLVTASLVTTILMMVYDYDTSRSRGRAIVVFDSIAFAIFILEISARMWCYRHVHSRLFPQFCKDPFNIVDLGVIGIDVVLYLAKSHGSGFTRLAKSLRALKIARFARAARVLRKLHELREKNLAKQQAREGAGEERAGEERAGRRTPRAFSYNTAPAFVSPTRASRAVLARDENRGRPGRRDRSHHHAHVTAHPGVDGKVARPSARERGGRAQAERARAASSSSSSSSASSSAAAAAAWSSSMGPAQVGVDEGRPASRRRREASEALVRPALPRQFERRQRPLEAV